MATAAGFLLCGYELLRSASNTLYKGAYGAENLPIVMAIMPFGIILAVYIYGRVLSWIGPRKTLFATSIISGLILSLCYLAIRSGSDVATGVLYVFREAYIILLIEQYWSFLNSTLKSDAARVLNGPIVGWSTLGSITGALLVHKLAIPFGTPMMVLFAGLATLPAAFCSDIGYRKCGEPVATPEEKGGKQGHLALHLFKDNRILPLLLCVVIATQVLSTVLDLNFQTILQNKIPDADQQTAFSGWFFAMLNGVAAILQFVGAPLLLRFLSLRTVHICIPLIHIGTCAVLTASPTLATAGAAYMAFKCFDYSLFRAAKELIYIPFSFDTRFRAKEVIDVFGYRFSKGGMSLLLLIVKKFGAVLLPLYSLVGLVAAGVWLGLIFPLTRTPALPPRDPSPID